MARFKTDPELDHYVDDVFFWKKILDEFDRKNQRKPRRFLEFMSYDFLSQLRAKYQAENEYEVDGEKICDWKDFDEMWLPISKFRDSLIYLFRRNYQITPGKTVAEKILAWQNFKKDARKNKDLKELIRIDHRLYPSVASRSDNPRLITDDLMKLLLKNPDYLVEFFIKHTKPHIRNIVREALFFYYEPNIKRIHRKSVLGQKSSRFWRSYEEDMGRLFEIFSLALFTYDPNKGNLMSRVSFLMEKRAITIIENEDKHQKRYLPILNDTQKNNKSAESQEISQSEINYSEKVGRIDRDERWAKYIVEKLKKSISESNEKRRGAKNYYENNKALAFITEFLESAQNDKKVRTDKSIAAGIGVSDRQIRNIKHSLRDTQCLPGPMRGLFLMDLEVVCTIRDEDLDNKEICFIKLDTAFENFIKE